MDYLSNRSQVISYKDIISDEKCIKCGVPQGLVLGPTLFLLYINDLPNSTDFFNFRLFADDSSIFHKFNAGQKEIDMEQVNIHLTKIQDWCNANKVTVNQDSYGDIISLSEKATLEMRYYRNNILHSYILPALICRLLDRHSKINEESLN